MGATRRFKKALIQPPIRDSDPPEVKDAFALRHAANASGRCPSCGATFQTFWHGPKVGQQVMEHESWCKAATDPLWFFETVTAETQEGGRTMTRTLSRGSRFNSENSSEWFAAVAALAGLGEEAVTAFAEATHEQRRDEWVAHRGLSESRGVACPLRLVRRRCAVHDHLNIDSSCIPPGDSPIMYYDHPSLWTKDGHPEVFVFQPYGMGHDHLVGIAGVCARFGLEIHIDTYPAWHFPGGTLFVEIRRR